MRVSDFDFDLPTELIAQTPAEPRTAAKLLHVSRDGPLADLGIADLPQLLEPGDLLVYNDTRVIPARLSGRRGDATRPSPPEGGVKVEITLHKALSAMTWKAFARPARKLKPRDLIAFAPGFRAVVEEKFEGGEVVLRFDAAESEFRDLLDRHGIMPLPPYIKRPPEGNEDDRDDYQTVFAKRDGAVAAPTASLHFTPELLEDLKARGIGFANLTLHVGAGTFLPVKVEDTGDHVMHSEWGEIAETAAAAINEARNKGGRIVAAGTTALRLLESAASEDGRVTAFAGDTDLFITPGYRFRTADLLLTNFHLPKSTLFMLVSAFSGLERMRAAYEHAKRSGYRFFSYGDATLLERAENPAKQAP